MFALVMPAHLKILSYLKEDRGYLVEVHTQD